MSTMRKFRGFRTFYHYRIYMSIQIQNPTNYDPEDSGLHRHLPKAMMNSGAGFTSATDKRDREPKRCSRAELPSVRSVLSFT